MRIRRTTHNTTEPRARALASERWENERVQAHSLAGTAGALPAHCLPPHAERHVAPFRHGAAALRKQWRQQARGARVPADALRTRSAARARPRRALRAARPAGRLAAPHVHQRRRGTLTCADANPTARCGGPFLLGFGRRFAPSLRLREVSLRRNGLPAAVSAFPSRG